MPRYKTAAQLVLLLSAIAMILLGMECVGIG